MNQVVQVNRGNTLTDPPYNPGTENLINEGGSCSHRNAPGDIIRGVILQCTW